MPRVSVLMPVYNGAEYLRASLDSILQQDFRDFELIVLNDGSRDNSGAIVATYDDPRIFYTEHPNMGLPATLNRGLALAKGDIIVRQDQDDISVPSRLSLQVAWLDKLPQLAMLGGWAVIVDADGRPDGRMHRHPKGVAALRLELLFNTPFVHSAVAMRKEVLQALGGYSTDPMRQPPEDFELWSRLLRTHEAANIPETVLEYREVAGSMSRVMKADFLERMVRVSADNVCYWAARSGREVSGELALFMAHRMLDQNGRHDGRFDCAATLAAFDAACDGIKAAGEFDDEAHLHQGRLRRALKRAWQVGACRSSLGATFTRMRWKCIRILLD